MRTGGYTWRRARAHVGLVGLLLAMAALVVVTLAGTLAYLGVASAAGLRDAVAAAPAAAQVLEVQTRLAPDADAQREGADRVLTGVLPAGADTWSTLRTPPVPLDGTESRAILLVDDAAAEHASLAEGAWPDGPDETAVHALAAETLGLAVGDTVGVTVEDGTSELTVTGLWLPADADDPHWAGDLLVATGTDPYEVAAHGPLLVVEEALAPLDVAPFVRWTVTPSALAPDALGDWLAALPRLAPALEEADLTLRGVTTAGSLPTTLADAQDSLASVRASSAIPLLVVALVSLVALWQITRLLAATRERETLVLLSRGAAPRQLVAIGAVEAAVVACGALLGGAAVAVAFAGRPGFALGGTLLVTAGTAVAVVAIMVAAVARAAATGLHPRDESGRVGSAVTGAALVLVAGLAAFSLWRFLRNGTPLVPGTQRVDVVAVGAPALGLVAVALAAVAVAGPVNRALAAVAARRPGFSPVTELRQSSRRISVNAVPVVLVVLAAAIATVASGYAGTWQTLRATSEQVSVGADARVDADGGIVTGRTHRVLDVTSAVEDVTATGVLQSAMRLGERVGQLTAFPIADAGVSSAPESVLGPVLPLLAPAADPLPGVALPPGAEELALDVTAAAEGSLDDGWAHREVSFRAWLAQGADLIRVDMGGTVLVASDRTRFDRESQEMVVVPDPDKGKPVTARLAAALPGGQWRLVAIDTVMSATFQPTDWRVSVSSVEADGAALPVADLDWDPAVLPMPGGEAYSGGDGPLSFTGTFQGDLVGAAQTLVGSTVQRFMPASGAGTEVPVVTTPGWRGEIRPTGTDVTLGATTLRLTQVGTIPVVPGNPDPVAALADLPTLQNALLRTSPEIPSATQVWVDGGDRSPAETAEALRVGLGPRAQVVATGEGVTDAVAAPARVVYWVAAVCALLLALPAVAAGALTQAAARRGEVVVLRAVGVGAAQQGRSRARELLGLEIGAVGVGVLAGWGLCALLMVTLVRATTPQVSRAVPVRLTFDVAPGAALLALVLAAVAAVALWYGARVRAQARDTTWREEIR